MDATNLPDTKRLLKELQRAYPQFIFKPNHGFKWEPRDNTITYDDAALSNDLASMPDLLHELGHALLGHQDYEFDIQLIKMEAEAWQKAAEVAHDYGIQIAEDYITSSLETYQDWLADRSTCPECTATGVQKNNCTYQCVNCRCSWRVNDAKFCALRRYRID